MYNNLYCGGHSFGCYSPPDLVGANQIFPLVKLEKSAYILVLKFPKIIIHSRFGIVPLIVPDFSAYFVPFQVPDGSKMPLNFSLIWLLICHC